MSLGQANVAAGYRNGNRKAAWITRQNPKIAARIVELTEEKLAAERLARERAQVKFDLSAERVLGELARIALANMQDYVTIGPDGQTRFIDPARLSRDQAAALQEMTIEEFTDHGKTKRRVRRLVPGPEPRQCERGQFLLGEATVDGRMEGRDRGPSRSDESPAATALQAVDRGRAADESAIRIVIDGMIPVTARFERG